MEETFVPFRGIKNDLKGRLLCYKQDWTGGLSAGIRFVTSIAQLHLCKGYNELNEELSEACEHHY